MKYILLLLFVGTFFVYSLSDNPAPKGDTTPARLLPFAILSGRGIYLDDFRFPLGSNPFWLQRFHDHYISAYPMIVGVLVTPIYLPVYIYLLTTGQAYSVIMAQYSYGLEKFSASLLTSVSVTLFAVLVYWLTRNKKVTFLLSLVFAFATPAFSINSRYLWQHGIAGMFLIAALLMFLRGSIHAKGRFGAYIVCLLFSVLAGWTRQIFFLFTGIMFAAIIWRDRRRFAWYGGIITAVVALFFAYNKHFYGALLGTTTEPLASFSLSNLLPGLAGLLFSPARGMLFYTPFFLIAYLVPLYWKRIREEPFHHQLAYAVLYMFFIAHTFTHALFAVWWAGCSWGDRFFADTAPVAVLFAYIVYRFSRKICIKVLICILILYSCFIQIVGVFYYPRGQWDGYPVSYDLAPGRLWDIRDNPIIRNLAVGPDLQAIYAVQYWLLHIHPGAITDDARVCTLAFDGWKQILGYRAARITLTNHSRAVWYTQGKNIVTLRQLWSHEEDKYLVESPVPSMPLPPIIVPGQTVYVDVLMIPPSSAYDRVVVAPVQEGVSWWVDNCFIELQP